MGEYNEQNLGEAEYDELAMLVDAADAGEDVTLLAFQRLCPSGQEGAFDQNAVFIYQTLAEAGLIEGVCEDGEFFFEGLTEQGIEAVRMPTGDAIEREEDASQAEEPYEAPSLSETKATTEHPAKSITKAFENGELTLPVAAGFIAGLIGGALAAVIVWAII